MNEATANRQGTAISGWSAPRPGQRARCHVPGADDRHELVGEDARLGHGAVVALGVLRLGGLLLVRVALTTSTRPVLTSPHRRSHPRRAPRRDANAITLAPGPQRLLRGAQVRVERGPEPLQPADFFGELLRLHRHAVEVLRLGRAGTVRQERPFNRQLLRLRRRLARSATAAARGTALTESDTWSRWRTLATEDHDLLELRCPPRGRCAARRSGDGSASRPARRRARSAATMKTITPPYCSSGSAFDRTAFPAWRGPGPDSRCCRLASLVRSPYGGLSQQTEALRG